MLIKLLRYDIAKNYKTQLSLIVSMLCLALVSLPVGALHNSILTSGMIFVGLFASLGVLISYMAFHILSFNNTMAGRESYFTYTLPVGIGRIILSKFISAVFWAAACVASVCLFWFGMIRTGGIEITGDVTGIFGAVFSMVVGQFICMMMTVAFSIGLSVHPKFGNIQSKAFVSIVAFIALYYAYAVLQIGILGLVTYIKGDLFLILGNDLTDAQVIDIMKYVYGYVTAVYAALSVLLFMLSVRIFGRHKSI